jgi:hypothetical protein
MGAGGAVRLEAELHRFLFLELQTAAEVAGVQSRFRVDGVEFHRTAPITGWVSLGVTARFR